MIRKLLGRIKRRIRPNPTEHSHYARKSVRTTFRKIYRDKVWGNDGDRFFSGLGSHGPAADMYCALVTTFINENLIGSIVDCGCGDYAVGKRLVDSTKARYTGVDVVPELIRHHRKRFQNSRASFLCADITRDRLPAADLCLVRQVLQHLTNAEIAQVLVQLRRFPRVLIAEDVPIEPKSINHDMTHGPEVRSELGSGVYVDHPPFSMPVKELARFPLHESRVLRIVLLENAGAPLSK